LTHEPDGGAVDVLGPAGANEDGIGRGHDWVTVAFSREGPVMARFGLRDGPDEREILRYA
jgi:hypothetical protein